MKKLILAIFLLATVARAQQVNNPLVANLTAQSTDCSVANSCAWQSTPLSSGTTVVTLAGSFSATLIVEQTNNGTSWVSLATLTGTGTTNYSQNGFTAIRVRCSAFTSGVVAVTVSTGTGGGGSGGSGTPVAGVFNAATSCGGLTNCVQWVDDDSTDNCGSATTTWVNAINAYSGKGVPQVQIYGSGAGKAYKFVSCNLIFTGGGASTGTGVAIHLHASIDCAMALQSCIQFGATATSGAGGSNATAMQSFRLDGGGAIIGGHSLTGSGGNGSAVAGGVYVMPHISGTVIDGISFGGTGANLGFGVNGSYGGCSTYAVMFDNPLPDAVVRDVVASINSNGVSTGACGLGNPGGASAGSNTIMFEDNIVFTDGEASGTGQCGSIGINDGGTLGSMSSNNVFGFGIPILLTGISHKLQGNQLDSTQCSAGGGVQSVIQFGGSGTVGPASIMNNSVQLDSTGAAHAKNLISLTNGGSATLTGVNLISNINNGAQSPVAFIMPSTLTCTPYGITNTCIQRDNVAMAQTIPSGTTGQGWQASNLLAQGYPATQTANLGATTLLSGTANYTANGFVLVHCQVVITTAATTSSTLPTCSVSYTDQSSNVAVTAQVTTTWAASTPGCSGSTTNQAGNSCQGEIVILPKTGVAITFATSNYASTGGTPMAYQVDATVTKMQ